MPLLQSQAIRQVGGPLQFLSPITSRLVNSKRKYYQEEDRLEEYFPHQKSSEEEAFSSDMPIERFLAKVDWLVNYFDMGFEIFCLLGSLGNFKSDPRKELTFLFFLGAISTLRRKTIYFKYIEAYGVLRALME